ncbi:PREDICTED: uncharacterized protein LOC106148472 isoform X1 [Chinchilla lanigera]|uniref:uncharacterized protein LOC106148472 isoform X1 n=1 Tax=Chinchilla lanigera TaxID=34839 RepID=UPI0006965A1E|nr:PREDICTED: uncharacterized protein LOC106148472 isoform X1 [Chinchilla lanigera]
MHAPAPPQPRGHASLLQKAGHRPRPVRRTRPSEPQPPLRQHSHGLAIRTQPSSQPSARSPVTEVKKRKKRGEEPDVVAHACNPSTWEAEARGSLQVQGQPGLQSGFAKPPTTTASMASHDPDDCLQLHLPLTCAKVAFLVPTHASVTTLMGSIFSTRSSWVGIMNLYSRLLIRQRQEDHLSPGVQPGQYSKIPLLNKINK